MSTRTHWRSIMLPTDMAKSQKNTKKVHMSYNRTYNKSWQRGTYMCGVVMPSFYFTTDVDESAVSPCTTPVSSGWERCSFPQGENYGDHSPVQVNEGGAVRKTEVTGADLDPSSEVISDCSLWRKKTAVSVFTVALVFYSRIRRLWMSAALHT